MPQWLLDNTSATIQLIHRAAIVTVCVKSRILDTRELN
ncbi:hypothetical protein C427_0500 [Paraglaciecola psychrophila 170]|uniref:Uncharacterized protein n=1 Tax=Paraglaciecola psychrophila 170 TaxID=1129794 RepID=M4RGF2_9ALTE|nr:hypothetical protein C427_0500 [Paraglaciecola psychrophila 170]